MFLDTSALYAVLDSDEDNHARAARFWAKIVDGEEGLATSNYIVVESVALIQRRLGMPAVRAFTTDLLPMLSLLTISAEQHAVAVAAMLAANRRDLSLVDCSTFELMRRAGETRVFTFDGHFRQHGFEVVPRS